MMKDHLISARIPHHYFEFVPLKNETFSCKNMIILSYIAQYINSMYIISNYVIHHKIEIFWFR